MNTKKNILPKKINKKEAQPVEEWYKKEISSDDFVILAGKDKHYYGQHNKWKKNVYIGPYKTKEEVDKVISSYESVTKKPFGSRKEIKNIHSILIEDKDFFI